MPNYFYLTFGIRNRDSILDIHLPPHCLNKGTVYFHQKRVLIDCSLAFVKKHASSIYIKRIAPEEIPNP